MLATAKGDQAAADFDITSIVIDEYAECAPALGLAAEASEIERAGRIWWRGREAVSAGEDARRAGG